MKNKNILWVVVVLLLNTNLFAQKSVTVRFTQKLKQQDLFSTFKKQPDFKSSDDKNKFMQGLFLESNQPQKIKGGMYADKKNKFIIALYDFNTNGIYNEIGQDMLLVVPDSVTPVPVVTGTAGMLLNKTSGIIIKAGTTLYTCTLNKDTSATIRVYNGPAIKPDVTVYNRLPDSKFALFNGGTAKFTDYTNKGKYIFVHFWGTWCGGCMSSMDELNQLAIKYQDKLTIIGMDCVDPDTANVSKVIKGHNLIWIQGIGNDDINQQFQQNGYPFGALFAPDGTLIYSGSMFPDMLAPRLEK